MFSIEKRATTHSLLFVSLFLFLRRDGLNLIDGYEMTNSRSKYKVKFIRSGSLFSCDPVVDDPRIIWRIAERAISMPSRV